MKTAKNIAIKIGIIAMFSMMMSVLVAQNQNNQVHSIKGNNELAPVHPDAPMPPEPPAPPAPPDPPAGADIDVPDLPAPPHFDLPDLTNDQKDKIQQADLGMMKTMTPLRNQIREKNARLQSILTTTPFDAKAADQAAEELGKTRTSILKELIRHDQELRGLLTPRQQVIFDSRPKPFLHRNLGG